MNQQPCEWNLIEQIIRQPLSLVHAKQSMYGGSMQVGINQHDRMCQIHGQSQRQIDRR